MYQEFREIKAGKSMIKSKTVFDILYEISVFALRKTKVTVVLTSRF